MIWNRGRFHFIFSRRALALFLSLTLTIEAGATGFGWFEPLRRLGRQILRPSSNGPKNKIDPTQRFVLVPEGNNGAIVPSNRVAIFDQESHRKMAEYLANQDDLKNVSPSALRKTGQFFKRHFIGSAIKFPIEAAAFFIALGAKATLELITNYPDHPDAIADFINGQTDPVGIISFYFFITFSGMTGELLNNFIHNKALRLFTPFLAMSVGSFVQQHTSQIMYDPNFQACAKNLVTRDIVLKNSPDHEIPSQEIDPNTGRPLPRSKKTPCANAWHDLVTQHHITEEVPGLISMLIASVLSGLTKEVFALAATTRPLRFIGFTFQAIKRAGSYIINSAPNPVTWVIKAVFTQVPNAYLFVTYNDLVEVPISYAFREHEDDEKIQELQHHLVESILEEKTQKWSRLENKKQCPAVETEETEDCIKDLPYYLEKFTQHMRKRREWLLRDVYNPSQQWEKHLKNFTGIRTSSYHVYQHYINALDEYRNTPSSDRRSTQFFQIAPLSGVNLPEDLAIAEEANYLGLREQALRAIDPNAASTEIPLNQNEQEALLLQIQNSKNSPKSQLYSDPKIAELKQREVVVIAGKLLDRFLRSSSENNKNLSVEEKRRLIYLRDIFYNKKFENEAAQFRNNGGPLPDFDKDILIKGRALEFFNKYYPSEYILSLVPTMGDQIRHLHRMYDEKRLDMTVFKPHAGDLYFKYLIDIKRVLGNPKPIMNPGVGWTYALEKYSPLNKQIEMNDEDRTNAHFETPLITDHILIGMMCGPDLEKNETIALEENTNLAGVSVPKGIPSYFLPPKISIDSPILYHSSNSFMRGDGQKRVLNLCDLESNQFRNLHTILISPSSNPSKVYRGVLNYMAHNTRDSVGSSIGAFESWWTQYVDKDVKKVMDNFQEDYVYLIDRLSSLIKVGDTESIPDPAPPKPPQKSNDLLTVNKEEGADERKKQPWYKQVYLQAKKYLKNTWQDYSQSASNFTKNNLTDDFMPKSHIETARQEVRIYLMILGEILKDNLRVQSKIPIRYNEFDNLYGQELKFPLFRDIRYTKNYDFENMLNVYAPNPSAKGSYGLRKPYPFQTQIENSFTDLFKAIKSLSTVQTINGPVITTKISQEKLDSYQKIIVDQLTDLSDVFSVGHNFAEAQGTELTSSQAAALNEILKQIKEMQDKMRPENKSLDSSSQNEKKKVVTVLVKGLGPREQRTVKLALKGMQMLAEEITNLGKIINAMAFIPTKIEQEQKEAKEKTGVKSILPPQDTAPKRSSILGQEGNH